MKNFKALAVLTSVSMLMGMSGCGNVETNSSDESSEITSTEIESEAATETEVPTEGTTSCTHKWTDATCTTPKTCANCGETSGSALGHEWTAATCENPKECTRCGQISGSALGHTWEPATLTSPKNCTRCGKTEGSALNYASLGTGYVDVDEDSTLLLREEMSENATQLASIAPGYEIEVWDCDSATWYYVLCDGQYGYVKSEYVTFSVSSVDLQQLCDDMNAESKKEGYDYITWFVETDGEKEYIYIACEEEGISENINSIFNAVATYNDDSSYDWYAEKMYGYYEGFKDSWDKLAAKSKSNIYDYLGVDCDLMLEVFDADTGENVYYVYLSTDDESYYGSVLETAIKNAGFVLP